MPQTAAAAYHSLPRMVRYGKVAAVIGGETQDVRLKLTEDYLSLQKEELAFTVSCTDHVDAAVLAKERTVQIVRQRVGGLGLSVKGGQEHNLPVLISRIFKDQAAYNTGQIFVGDAVLRVNDVSIEAFSHDDAVSALKNAGELVVLVVKYFQSASLFLAKARRNSQLESDQENQLLPATEEDYIERQWTDILSVPLVCATLTRYKPGSDLIRRGAFELIAADGATSGLIQVSEADGLQDWIDCITRNMIALNNHFILTTNKQQAPTEQIVHLCSVCERLNFSDQSARWESCFLALKGADVLLYTRPPMEQSSWQKYRSVEKIYECVLRAAKETELVDRRRHVFTVESGEGVVRYMAVDSRVELHRLEKAWHRANYQAVRQLGDKSFRCKWRGQKCCLTLDLNIGFSLYDEASKANMWSYRFAQLKGSSDDGRSLLKLHFLNSELDKLDSRTATRVLLSQPELDCPDLQTLIFCMHAFLSAKLASVDPCFLMSI